MYRKYCATDSNHNLQTSNWFGNFLLNNKMYKKNPSNYRNERFLKIPFIKILGTEKVVRKNNNKTWSSLNKSLKKSKKKRFSGTIEQFE